MTEDWSVVHHLPSQVICPLDVFHEFDDNILLRMYVKQLYISSYNITYKNIFRILGRKPDLGIFFFFFPTQTLFSTFAQRAFQESV